MWDLVNTIYEYWFLVLWLALVILAYVYGGRRAALLVLSLGGGAAAYYLGKKTVRDDNKKAVQHIQEKREKAYDKITSRNTGKRDVIDRMRNGSY